VAEHGEELVLGTQRGLERLVLAPQLVFALAHQLLGAGAPRYFALQRASALLQLGNLAVARVDHVALAIAFGRDHAGVRGADTIEVLDVMAGAEVVEVVRTQQVHRSRPRDLVPELLELVGGVHQASLAEQIDHLAVAAHARTRRPTHALQQRADHGEEAICVDAIAAHQAFERFVRIDELQPTAGDHRGNLEAVGGQ
jgi:hypothetical protein